MQPEHFLSTRSDSGLGPLENKDLVELQGNYENFGFLLGVEQSPFERRAENYAERGYYLQTDFIIDTYKFGFHYWKRQSDIFTKERYGAHALLGLSKKWALLTDWQFQQQLMTQQKRTWGRMGGKAAARFCPCARAAGRRDAVAVRSEKLED